MLPIIVQHLPRDRERLGLRPVQMAGRLELTLAEYGPLEAGELHISNDLYERIVELCGWPRWGEKVRSRRNPKAPATPRRQ
jgi:hypothetical protein